MKKIRAIVSGKVQGVSYRMYTQAQARQLGVLGYVRNLSNGDVEIIAVGNAQAVDALMEWANSGSPSAIVNHVDIKPITDVEDFNDFAIRY
ncbi:acylphosphatase [Chondrocystis sp. NIES-4102]|nr:acylphosphatase [Chondrocystis sp. NIES-4102]